MPHPPAGVSSFTRCRSTTITPVLSHRSFQHDDALVRFVGLGAGAVRERNGSTEFLGYGEKIEVDAAL
jgi:hypothetical protein